MRKKGFSRISKPQQEVFNMLKEMYPNCEQEVPCGRYSLDCVVYFDNYKIDVEYDGLFWHQDKYRDIKRDNFVKKNGYKVLRIKGCKHDTLPSKDQLAYHINKLLGECNYTEIIMWQYKHKRFKFDTSNFNSTPYLAPFLKDSIRNEEIGILQYNKDIQGAYGILAGEIRLFDSAKSGTKANQFAIDPKTLGAFMGKVKQGLETIGGSNANTKAVAMPTENIKWFQFNDSNTNMYNNQLANSAGVGSGISRVIYSSDRMSNAEIEAGIIDQYNTVRRVYSQFNNFLEFFGNQLTKKYKFSLTLDGCSYPFEREKRFERLKIAADKGLVLAPSAWASAMGYKPQEFERLLEESKYSGWVDELSQLMLNVNTTKQDGEVGRPRKDTGLTDSGEASRDDINGL